MSAEAKPVTAMRSPGLKFLLIVGLSIAMAVPLFFIQLALSDREQTASTAASDVASGWGGEQVVAGPVLVVPYTQVVSQVVDGKNVLTTTRFTKILLPENLSVTARAKSDIRNRGIFVVPVYSAQIHLQANFEKAALAALLPTGAQALWNEAFVSLVVSDSQGLADNVNLTVNGQSLAFQPGNGIGPDQSTRGSPAIQTDNTLPSGIHVPLSLTGPDDLKLDTSFVLRGSRMLSVSPLGRRTVTTLQSDWASPSFFGAFLPSDRKVGADGFSASWTVPYLARGFGQSMDGNPGALQTLLAPAFGVRFYQPVDYYQLVQRALKYAILFVALSFLLFFVMESLSPQRLHAVQYTLIGAAQVLFYLLLLSLCEHIGFGLSYLIAGAATVGVTALYAKAVLASLPRAAILGMILTALYGLMYVILNAEDYALLIGSLVLFVALAGTMYVTRRIDWQRLADGMSA